MSSLLARYKTWVRKNNSVLSLWETGLSSLTWILPDRFNESELALEAIHTAINLLSTFHDSIVTEDAGEEAPGAQLVFWLGALQQVQVLVELGAASLEAQGRGNRFDALALVEALKALIRMLILYRSHSRMLTNGGLTNFEQACAAGGLSRGALPAEARAHQVVDAFAQFRARHCNLGAVQQQQQQQEEQQGGQHETECQGCYSVQSQAEGSEVREQPGLWWQAPEAAGAICKHPPASASSSGIGSDAWGSEVRAVQAWAARRQALAMRLIIAGELLHILRPVAYTLALRRWGRPSWRPWLASLALDLLSWQLSTGGAALSQRSAQRAAAAPALKGNSVELLLRLQAIGWSREERDELTRRKLLLAYYLLRDPLFAHATGPALARWQGIVGRLPLAGWVSGKLVELVCGIQHYYTYTAAS